MDSERLQRVQDLFHAALERPASERAAYLDSACQGDAELRSEVERYIAADSGEFELLDQPVRTSDSAAHRPSPPSLAGRQIGHYRIERLIGEGGMATVYLADDLKHDRKVALKVLKPELAAVVGAERFLAEIKNTAKLQHPHILPLFDSGDADGLLFYVMPYVDGESLREKIARDGPLPVEDAIRLLREVADGLAYAHGQGLIHRDIKPANVLLSGRHATIADFGIAKAVSTSTRSQASIAPSTSTPSGCRHTRRSPAVLRSRVRHLGRSRPDNSLKIRPPSGRCGPTCPRPWPRW